MCINCGNEICPKASRFGVSCPHGMMPEAPDIPCGTFRFAGPALHLHRTGLDSPALSSAEQAKSVRGPVLTFTRHSQLFHKNGNCASAAETLKIPRKIHAAKILAPSNCTEMVHREPEEISGKFLVLAVRTRKFIYPQRVRANQQAIFFDKDHAGFQSRSVHRVDLVFRSAYPVLVKMHQRVV